jgi:hypothetical protein
MQGLGIIKILQANERAVGSSVRVEKLWQGMA